MERIIITQNESGTFNVKQGERWADNLCWDEMQGLIAAMTMPEQRQCLQWLRTDKQHSEWKKQFKKINV